MPPPTVKGPPPLRPQALESLRYQAILDTARDAIISIDRQGIVTDYNQAALAIFGYEPDEVIGSNVSMLMPSPYREEHDGYLRAYQRTGEKKAIGRIREVQAKRKSGEVFAIELSVSEARIGDELLYTAIIRDVSALKRARAWGDARHEVTRVLAMSETLAEASRPLLEVIREVGGWDAGELWAVWAGSPRSTAELRFAGSAAAAGLDPNAFDARPSRFALGEGLLGRAWELGAPVLATDLARNPAFFRRKLAAELGLGAGVAFPVLDERGVVAVMAFYSRDPAPIDEELLRLMTSLMSQIGEFVAHKRAEDELRRLEGLARERERLADIGAITAKLVHDLGNPLSGISMQAELLQRKALRDEAPASSLLQPIDRILGGVSRLRELVRGFTDFAREQRLELTAVEPASFLGDLVEQWRPIAAEHRIDLRVALADGLPPLTCDELKLRRVFDNLVKNAIEAIESGDGVVCIDASASRDGKLRIAVSDTGTGIAPGTQVFRLFETTKPLGTGIGLSVSKEIVSAHGGSIAFAPNSPSGTVFTIELPVGGPSA